MIALFTASIIAAVVFSITLLLTLKEDINSNPPSQRPLYLLLFAIGLWFMTYFALIAPETPYISSYSAYNVITPTGTIIYPAYNVTNIPSPTPSGTLNDYFFFWIIILTIHFFLLLMLYINLFSRNAQKALAAAREMNKK
jgi:beta-lactamase regulating signal transducer with metallopeptidase domain